MIEHWDFDTTWVCSDGDPLLIQRQPTLGLLSQGTKKRTKCLSFFFMSALIHWGSHIHDLMSQVLCLLMWSLWSFRLRVNILEWHINHFFSGNNFCLWTIGGGCISPDLVSALLSVLHVFILCPHPEHIPLFSGLNPKIEKHINAPIIWCYYKKGKNNIFCSY